jgi:hypothetical protein
MDLIDRYLHAVKGHLPSAQQDVVAELEDDLRSRIAEREEELGRPLGEDETAAILKSLGRPMVFAARYQKQQALIGAAMMPYYVLTLKVGLAIALGVNVVVALVMLAVGKPLGESLRGLVVFPFTTAPIQVGWITVVFALLDRYVTAHPFTDSWDPKSLPPVRRERPVGSRMKTVEDIVGMGVLLAWWVAMARFPFLILGPLAVFLKAGPGWQSAQTPVAMLMLVALGGHVLALVRPSWRRPTKIAGHLLALAGLGLLWFGGDLLVPTGVTPPEKIAHGVEAVDRYARAGLGLVVAITLYELVRDLLKLRRARVPAALLAVAVVAVSGCVPKAPPFSPRIVRSIAPGPQARPPAGAVFGSRIDATRIASMTSAAASTSSPDV